MLMDVVKPVYVRKEPSIGGALVGDGLGPGDQVEVLVDVTTEADGYIWRQHAETGYWSAGQKIGANLYLLEVLTPDADDVQTTQMKVINDVNVRASATTNSEDVGGLSAGDEVEVFPAERTVDGNYVWVRHGNSQWSAQVRLSDGKVFMERMLEPTTKSLDLSDIRTSSSAADLVKDEEEAEPSYQTMDVVREVEVHETAGLSGTVVDTLTVGMQFDVMPDLSETKDDFVWRKIAATGFWTKEKEVAGGLYLVEAVQPDSDDVETATLKVLTDLNVRADHNATAADVGDLDPGAYVTVYPKDRYIGPNYVWQRIGDNQWAAQVVIATGAIYMEPLPKTFLESTSSADLKLATQYGPGFRSLFQKLPVSMTDMKWFFYFGNTVIAYKCRETYGYGYAQGLHGGVDLGNKTSAKVIAGVDGIVTKIETKNDANHRVWVKTDDNIIIYQHVWNEVVSVNQAVTPDTVLCEVRPWKNGGLDHLHLEVRDSSGSKILNPLWMMPQTMCDQIIDKYPATGSAAFLEKYGQYLSPLDQPIITNVASKPENFLIPVGFLSQAELDAIPYSC